MFSFLKKKLKEGVEKLSSALSSKPAAEEKPAEEANVTGLTALQDQLKDRYFSLEQEYQNKSLANYQLGTIYDQLKETRSYIANAQSYLLEGEFKKAEANLEIAKDNLDIIDGQLKSAKKKEKTLADKIRENIIYIGSTAAAIVSIFAAYAAIHRMLQKQKEMGKEKIKRLRERIDERKKAAMAKGKKGVKEIKKANKKEGKKANKKKKLKK